MTLIACTVCGKPYPDELIPHLCRDCGGIFDFRGFPTFDPAQINVNGKGLWRYRSFFDLPDNAPVVSLGEGGTPLIWQYIAGIEVGFKLESLNPTGSYKDRGSAVLASLLKSRDIRSAVEDSSGNAGASFSAYAATSGISARIFVPDSASGPKKEQIIRYGAQLIPIPGSREATAQAVLNDIRPDNPYASHAYLPFGMAGIATIAYEIWEEMGRVPGTVIAPAGHGSLMLGIARGFEAIQKAGRANQVPRLVAVQAEGCSPMVQFSRDQSVDLARLESKPTIAEGVRVKFPVRMIALEKILSEHDGGFFAVEEDEILPAFGELAQHGIYVEPTSALVWAAYQHLKSKLPQPIVLVMTGSGLKYAS